MQLELYYEKYIETKRDSTGEYLQLAARFKIYVQDQEHNLFVFRSDGLQVKASDLLFVHMRSERSRNSYTYRDSVLNTKVMSRPTTLYSESSNATAKTAADVKLIKAVIGVVTSRPVEFPADDIPGLSQNKVILPDCN